MTRPVIHFVHGNSFPAGTYRMFFRHLNEHYDVQALSMHAHNPAYPVTDGWQALKQELVAELATRYMEPVILVGHSMGGILSLMAAASRPDLLRGVVLLDSPVVAGWRAQFVRIAKRLRLDAKFPPAQLSARRRTVWPSLEDAYAHFASKPMFARWPEQVLRDYLEHGLVPHPQGVTLRYSREVETAVYRSLPHDLGRLVRSGIRVPVGFIGGVHSVECRQAGLGAVRRLVGRHFMQVQGGHLFPMEAPDIAAGAVHRLIRSMVTD